MPDTAATAQTATLPRSRCVLHLRHDVPLTDEHIFPEAAGGRIKRPILCKPCNDRLGLYVDAPYVKQKTVELARVTYRLAGKTGQIPQPFSDTYTIDVPDGTLKIRLDSSFAPRTIPQAPLVWVAPPPDTEPADLQPFALTALPLSQRHSRSC